MNFTDTSQGRAPKRLPKAVPQVIRAAAAFRTVFALPSFQSGITGMITSGRNQPDYSLPFFPVAVYTGGKFGRVSRNVVVVTGIGGSRHRSRPTPRQQTRLANPTIYSLFQSTGYSTYFTPCTSGSNGLYSCKRFAVQSSRRYRRTQRLGARKRALAAVQSVAKNGWCESTAPFSLMQTIPHYKFKWSECHSAGGGRFDGRTHPAKQDVERNVDPDGYKTGPACRQSPRKRLRLERGMRRDVNDYEDAITSQPS